MTNPMKLKVTFAEIEKVCKSCHKASDERLAEVIRGAICLRDILLLSGASVGYEKKDLLHPDLEKAIVLLEDEVIKRRMIKWKKMWKSPSSLTAQSASSTRTNSNLSSKRAKRQ